MNANFRVISTKVFPSTLIVLTPFIYKLHNFFVELSLSRTRFSEMKQSPLDSHRHCYHYEFYKKNTILLSMKDREKRKKNILYIFTSSWPWKTWIFFVWIFHYCIILKFSRNVLCFDTRPINLLLEIGKQKKTEQNKNNKRKKMENVNSSWKK